MTTPRTSFRLRLWDEKTGADVLNFPVARPHVRRLVRTLQQLAPVLGGAATVIDSVRAFDSIVEALTNAGAHGPRARR